MADKTNERMIHWMNFEIILIDIKGILSDFRPKDLGPFFFWGMWFAVLLSSLRGVDRRDEIAQVTYMAVVSGIGVIFLLVFPLGQHQNYTPHGQITLFLFLVMLPSLRWLMRRKITELDLRLKSAKEDSVTKK